MDRHEEMKEAYRTQIKERLGKLPSWVPPCWGWHMFQAWPLRWDIYYEGRIHLTKEGVKGA
jgi:hypothetical protein